MLNIVNLIIFSDSILLEPVSYRPIDQTDAVNSDPSDLIPPGLYASHRLLSGDARRGQSRSWDVDPKKCWPHYSRDIDGLYDVFCYSLLEWGLLRFDTCFLSVCTTFLKLGLGTELGQIKSGESTGQGSWCQISQVG